MRVPRRKGLFPVALNTATKMYDQAKLWKLAGEDPLRMPLCLMNEKMLLFVHIPKCGGSTIETYLQQKGKLGFKLKGRKGWCKTVPQHVHAEIYEPLFPDGFVDETFTVFRHPVERILSEYRYRVDNMAETQPFSDWLEQNLAIYANDPYALDNHLRPQVEFLCDGIKIFRFEDGLDTVMSYIDEQSGSDPIEQPIWEKKSSAQKPVPSEADLDKITAFYAEDLRVYDLLTKGQITVWSAIEAAA